MLLFDRAWWWKRKKCSVSRFRIVVGHRLSATSEMEKGLTPLNGIPAVCLPRASAPSPAQASCAQLLCFYREEPTERGEIGRAGLWYIWTAFEMCLALGERGQADSSGFSVESRSICLGSFRNNHDHHQGKDLTGVSDIVEGMWGTPPCLSGCPQPWRYSLYEWQQRLTLSQGTRDSRSMDRRCFGVRVWLG